MPEHKIQKSRKNKISSFLAKFITLGQHILSPVIYLRKKILHKFIAKIHRKLFLISHMINLRKERKKQQKKVLEQRKIRIGISVKAIYKTIFNLEEILAKFISESKMAIGGIMHWKVFKKPQKKNIVKELAKEIPLPREIYKPHIKQEDFHQARLNIKVLNEINMQIEHDYPNLAKLVKNVARERVL